MTEEQSKWWAEFSGLMVGVAILVLMALVVLFFLTSEHMYHEPSVSWSETVMRLLFGSAR